MNEPYFVAHSLEDCAAILARTVKKGISGTAVDRYELTHPAGGRCVVLTFEKYYLRAGARLTLTAVLDNYTGKNRVFCTVSGEDGYDNGASAHLLTLVLRALEEPGD